MMGSDALIDTFINANVLFFIGFALWFIVRAAMDALGLRHAYATQLRLLNAVFLAILAAPFVAQGMRMLQEHGIARDVNMNLSDAVVAHYLNGGFEMDSSRFEALVLMRDTFVLDLISASGPMAQIVIGLFLLGLAIGLFRLGMSIFCLWSIVSDSYAWRSFGRVRIRLSDRTLVPFSTRGIRNYYVVIPSHMLGQSAELRVAFAHEFQHIRQGDLEWEVLMEALKPLFFLNPAYRVWKRRVEHLRELNCDAEVLARGKIEVRDYCETLLSICQKTLRRDRAFVLAVPKVTLVTADRGSMFMHRRSLLEHRIRSALMLRRTGSQKLLFALIVVPLLVAVTISTVAIQSPGDWSHDRLMLSTVVNLDRLDEINRLSTFGRVRN